jgi:lysophospholipase L1-like esterase
MKNRVQWFICLLIGFIFSSLANASIISKKTINKSENKTKLYIAGNSTAKNEEENGWGSQLQKFFDSEKLEVINRAKAGRSSRTFITEGLWTMS